MTTMENYKDGKDVADSDSIGIVRDEEMPDTIDLPVATTDTEDECKTDYSSSDNDDSSSYGDDDSSYLDEDDKSSGLFLTLDAVQMMRKSSSDGNIFSLSMVTAAKQMSAQNVRRNSGGGPSRVSYALQTKSAMESHAHMASREADIPKPKQTYENILKEYGITAAYKKSTEVQEGFFAKGCLASHSLELMTAVRQGDMAKIRKYHKAGHNLQTANKFGESIVHAVSRRGMPDCLKYLQEKVGVSLRVCCDQGRTALHDAAWTGQPNFDVVRILLGDCPDALLLLDNRNCTPLDFVPKDAHEDWNEFLLENKDLLRPKGLF